MKKVYSLILALLLLAGASQAQCTINPAAQTTPGVSPTAANLPCVIRTIAYDQTLQAQIDTAFDTTITIVVAVAAHFRIDSMRLDSVVGLPAGINWTKSPDILLGGHNGCVKLSGTTTAATGRYYIDGYGTVWTRGQGSAFGQTIDTPYVYQGKLNDLASWGNYYVDVINQGGACHQVQSGINDFNSALNAALSVYPNPSTGVFEVRLNAGSRVEGDMNVVDVTGRVVYSQKLDVIGLYNTSVDLTNFSKGLYTLQLRTAEGVASKNISVE